MKADKEHPKKTLPAEASAKPHKCSHCGREIPDGRGWYQYGAEVMCLECHDEKGGSLTR